MCAQLPPLQPEEWDVEAASGLGNTPLLWSHMEAARALVPPAGRTHPAQVGARRARRVADRALRAAAHASPATIVAAEDCREPRSELVTMRIVTTTHTIPSSTPATMSVRWCIPRYIRAQPTMIGTSVQTDHGDARVAPVRRVCQKTITAIIA